MADIGSKLYDMREAARVAHGKVNEAISTGRFDVAMVAVHDLERATKSVRAWVRKSLTASIRKACAHPEDRRFVYHGGSSRCGACGLNFKAPKEATA